MANLRGGLMAWKSPLKTLIYPDAPGQFGAIRKYDIHTGIDFYCNAGSLVTAVEDGVIIAIEIFTGPAVGSSWWNETYAVLVRGVSGVVLYGEVNIEYMTLKVGDVISAGQAIGRIGTPVLKKDKGRPRHMLHLELMKYTATQSLEWKLNEPQPDLLLDPTPYLSHLPMQQFDLNSYMNHVDMVHALQINSLDDLNKNFTGVVYAYYSSCYLWLVNRIVHRDDGPAMISYNGDKIWWLNGCIYSQEEWFDKLTPEQQIKALFNMDNW